MLHALQFLDIHLLLSAFFSKTSECNNVGKTIEKHGVGRCSVASGSSYFLIETLDALGQVVVHNPAHVAFVDAHTEGDGGADHLYIVAFEGLLGLGARLG